MEFEWNIFHGFNTLQLSEEVKRSLLRLDGTPENFTGRITVMSMFNDILCGSKDNEKDCLANAKLFSLFAKKDLWFWEKVVLYQWRQATRWMRPNGGKDDGDTRRKRTPSLSSHESIVQRSALKQGGGKLPIHYRADQETITTVFRTIICVHQLSLYGAVAEMCEKYETFHGRTGQLVVEGSRVLHSCQAWSRHTCFWKVVTVLTKVSHGRNPENALKSYHNKTDWVNFVWMQDFWILLRTDSISSRKIQVRPDHEEILLDRTAQSGRNGETLRDRSGQLDIINFEEVASSQNFMGRGTTELELSLGSRSFVNRVNDQVRNRQKRISYVACAGEEHAIICWMFVAVTMNAATFMGKNFQDSQNSIMNCTDLILKKMFDISAKLGEKEEINNVDKILW